MTRLLTVAALLITGSAHAMDNVHKLPMSNNVVQGPTEEPRPPQKIEWGAQTWPSPPWSQLWKQPMSVADTEKLLKLPPPPKW